MPKRTHDLGRVEPRHSEPSDGEERVEREEEDGSDDSGGDVVLASIRKRVRLGGKVGRTV